MMNEKVKELIQILIEMGHNPKTIRDCYLQNLTSEKDIDSILDFLKKNPKASKSDVNFEIHRIHLANRGIQL